MDKVLSITMLKTMVKIRRFEEKVVELFGRGEIPGWIHSYIGEEAVATGVCVNLTDGDYITSTHRGHGHCVAKGVDTKKMMAELFAKKTGCCKGRGGSMHICDSSVGILSANGIVGGGIPIATGAAFGCQYLKNKKIVASFFGDGAADQGSFHESLNLASIWQLPILYVCENNQYAETNPCATHLNIENIAERSKAYGIPGIVVNGMDVLAVYDALNKVVHDVRDGKGPVLVEAKTYRYRGHWEGDPEVYRTRGEIEEWKKKDPIMNLQNKMLREGSITNSDIEAINQEISSDIDDAIEYARKSPYPLKEEAMDYIYG